MEEFEQKWAQFIEDLVKGLMAVVEKYCLADPLNIGTDEEIKIRDMVKLIIKLSGKKTISWYEEKYSA